MTRGEGRAGHATATPRRQPRLGMVAAIGIILLLATAAIWVYALIGTMPIPGFALSAESVAALIRSWGMSGIAATIGLMVVHSFIPFPGEFVALAAGMIYGPVWGTLITWSGAMLGAFLSFGLARWLGRPFVEAVLAERHRRALDTFTARRGTSALLISRFIPVIAFNLINYAAGLTRVSWLTFAWTTGVGILPLTALMVVMGDRMTALTGWGWTVLTVGAVVFWLIYVVLRARRRAHGRAREGGTSGKGRDDLP